MKKIPPSLTLIFLTLISQYTSASNVASVSQESFAQYGKEDAYWVVTVACDNQSKHIVQRKTDHDTWCPKANNNLCSDDKKIAFENACSNESTVETEVVKAVKVVKAAEIEKVKVNETENAKVAVQKKRVQTLAAQDVQEKATIEQRIRAAEQKIQQQFFIEDSLASIQKEIRTLDGREQEIQQRLAQINELIESENE